MNYTSDLININKWLYFNSVIYGVNKILKYLSILFYSLIQFWTSQKLQFCCWFSFGEEEEINQILKGDGGLFPRTLIELPEWIFRGSLQSVVKIISSSWWISTCLLKHLMNYLQKFPTELSVKIQIWDMQSLRLKDWLSL